LLRNWFLRPVANLAILGERHDTIEQLIKSPDIMQELQKSLKKVVGTSRELHAHRSENIAGLGRSW
jgi:DNA mismatch repair ATPase MutS